MKTLEIKIPSDKKLTVGGLISAAVKKVGAKDIYLYDPFGTNCQRFAFDLLNTAGLLDAASKDWILQKVDALIKSNPTLVKFMRGRMFLVYFGLLY